ncbi:MAG: hypothetical protein OXH38_04280 [Chloroflexi bacterium]|nr:hypothetical protein [Chloroflexota bacterium]
MERRLTLRIEGPGIPQGKIALKDLQRIVAPLEQAIRTTLTAPSSVQTEGGSGKRPDARFLLLGIQSGSAIAELELESETVNLLPSLESDPVLTFLTAIGTTSGAPGAELKQRIDRVAKGLPAGVDWIELGHDELETPIRITKHIETAREEVTSAFRTISGRLEEVDFGAGLARLRVPANRRRRERSYRTRLRFADELASDMQRYLRQMVAVHGTAKMNLSGGVRELQVERIHAGFDDRRALWPSKTFRWPTVEERLDNVDVDEFLDLVHGVDEEAV